MGCWFIICTKCVILFLFKIFYYITKYSKTYASFISKLQHIPILYSPVLQKYENHSKCFQKLIKQQRPRFLYSLVMIPFFVPAAANSCRSRLSCVRCPKVINCCRWEQELNATTAVQASRLYIENPESAAWLPFRWFH